jgi:hypothetical protein
MGDLTEAEIFSCLADNFKSAAQDCDTLSKRPRNGRAYDDLRRKLKLIEGACRQAAYWRQDTRWLPIGLMIEDVHQRAGGWLRGVPTTDGRKIPLAAGQLHPLFAKLADNLRALYTVAEDLRTKATGRSGIILPDQIKAPTRTQGRQIGWTADDRVTSGGIITLQ